LFYISDYNGDENTADSGWYFCEGELDWSEFNPEGNNRPDCLDRGTDAAIDFTALVGSDLVNELSVGESERRWVSIDSCNESGCQQYVYINADNNENVSTTGFYQAEWGQNGLQAITPLSQLSESDGSFVNVNLGGSIYVAYVGFEDTSVTTTGWVTKELTGFNRDTWMPTFSSDGDRPFTPERGQEYYMHANGQNYVVTRTTDTISGPSSFSAKLELQTAANPRNTSTTASILPTGTSYLAPPWDQNVKLELVENPSNENYLLLVVQSDSSGSLTTGSVYTDDTWGLTAFNANNEPLDANGVALTVDQWGWVDPQASGNDGRQPVQFNYEYVGSDGDSWGKQQFLVTPDLTTYIILDDPITLANVELYDNLGNATDDTVSLQYDGWMHGMPDLYRELERNNWTVDETIGGKVRRLLPGQEVTDTEGTRYFVKPMEVSLFLGVVGEETIPDGQVPDITLADNVDLTSVPDYTHHEMGAAPTTDDNGNAIQVKYSEGIPLSSSGS